MSNSLLVRPRNLADFHQFPLFCPFLKGGKDSRFFLYAHIAMIAAVMIARNRLNTIISVFGYKSCYRASMESRCRRNLLG